MSYSSTVLATSGLIGYWRLGEPSGTNANDEAAGGNDGTIAGSPTMGVTGLQTSDADTAITFDGSDDTIDCGNPALFQLANVAVSMEFILKTSDPGNSFRGIVVKSGAWGAFFIDGNLRIYDWTSGLETLGPATDYTDDAPHHVLASIAHSVADGSFIMVDGEVAWTGTYGMTPTLTNPLTIGSNNGIQIFTGTLDEVAIYDTNLSEATGQAHYAAMAASDGEYYRRIAHNFQLRPKAVT
jgi:hypothetical protein